MLTEMMNLPINNNVNTNGFQADPSLIKVAMSTSVPQSDIFEDISTDYFERAGEKIDLTVVHTNDLHGNLEPFPVNVDGQRKLVGGEAAISSVIAQQKKEALDRGDGFLLLDGGDMTSGSALSGMFEGRPMIEAMNQEGYNAAAVGNHELDWGVQGLKNIIHSADFPLLSANLKDADGTPIAGVKPYIISDIKGVKVGIVGLITQKTTQFTSVEEVKSLQVEDPVATLQREIPKMREEGAQAIILLSHMEDYEELAVANNVDGINLIVSAHDHKKKHLKVGDTYIVESGYGGGQISKLNVGWDPRNNRVISFKSEFIPINPDEINPDKEVLSIINKYEKKRDAMDPDRGIYLGLAEEDFLCPEDGEETSLGNFIADTVAKAGHTSIAFVNSGAIRANLLEGDITKGDIDDVLPFESKIVTMRMKGKDIRQALEDSAVNEKRSLHVSGLKVYYNPDRPQGDKICSIWTDEGKIVNDEKEYSVSALEYLSGGGDGYNSFLNAEKVGMSERTIQEEVMDAVKKRRVLHGYETDRMNEL